MRRSIARDTLWFIVLTLSLVLLTVFATHFVQSSYAKTHFKDKLNTVLTPMSMRWKHMLSCSTAHC